MTGIQCEERLRDWVLDQARRGFPLNKPCFMYSVEKLVTECYNLNKLPFTDGKPGEKWFRCFLNRHPIISQKKSEYLSKCRAKVTETSV